MAYCEKYNELSYMDKKETEAMILHLLREDEFSFDQVIQLIRMGEVLDKFKNVKFGRQINDKNGF